METLLSDKPYGFVPISETVERKDRIPHNKLQRDLYSGKIELKITAMAPLHIKQSDFGLASLGNVNNRQNSIFYVTTNRNGIPVIPGSSIKGVVRSIAEAVSHSCAPKLPYDESLLKKALPSNNNSPCTGKDNKVCITCSMFGYVSGDKHYKGRVWFNEFKLQGQPSGHLAFIDIPVLNAPFSKSYPSKEFFPSGLIKGKDYGNERLYYCDICNDKSKCFNCHNKDYLNLVKRNMNRTYKFRGRKFYMHSPNIQKSNKSIKHQVIKKGSIFRGYVVFENLNREELSLLCFAMGLDGTFYPGLGYGKPAYLGKIRIEATGFTSMFERYGVNSQTLSLEILRQMALEYGKREDLVPQITALRRILGQQQGPAWKNINNNFIY